MYERLGNLVQDIYCLLSRVKRGAHGVSSIRCWPPLAEQHSQNHPIYAWPFCVVDCTLKGHSADRGIRHIILRMLGRSKTVTVHACTRHVARGMALQARLGRAP